MKSERLTLFIDPTVAQNFARVAEADHLDPNAFAKLLIAKFSDLKQGAGLSALTSIPAELFKGRAGRPASGSIGTAGYDIDNSADEYVTKSGIRIPIGKGAQPPSTVG